MAEREEGGQYRLLVLIINPRLTRIAEKAIYDENLPLAWFFHGFGTASNDFKDILGIGSPAKGICAVPVPRTTAERLIRRLRRSMGLERENSGVAFTVPITGATSLMLQLLAHLKGERGLPVRKGETEMPETYEYSLVVAVVRNGFSTEAMRHARTGGASGGTVIHCRRVGDEDVVRRLGLELDEEKEIVLIITEESRRLQIMEALGENCGAKTEAGGIILSFPVEQVMGLTEF